MRMKRLLWIVGASMIGAASAQARVPLALNWKAEPEFGGFYAAELSGAFQKRGLKVDITEGGAGTPIVQMVASGKTPYGIVAGDEVVISQDRGTDVVALFAVYQNSPQGIMAHEERGFKSIDDVFMAEGSLALILGSAHALYMQKLHPNAKAKIVPFLGGIGNFLNDPNYSQQCFVTSEPLAAAAKGQKAKAFLFSEAGLDPYLTVLVTRRSYLQKNWEEVKAMVQAVREGWEHYLKQPDETNALMNRLNPSMDAKTFKAVADLQKKFIVNADTRKHGLGSMREDRWRKLSEQLFDLKLIKKKKAPSDYFILN